MTKTAQDERPHNIHAVLTDPEDHLYRLRLRKRHDYYASVFGDSIDWAVGEIDRLREQLEAELKWRRDNDND